MITMIWWMTGRQMSDSLQRALKAEIPVISVMFCMRYLLMRTELPKISAKQRN